MKLLANRLESKIPVFSLIISAIVAWLIVPPVTGFPMVAFFLFFTGVSSLVYLVKKNKSWFDRMFYIGILFLSFFTIYRTNDFLQFFDFIFIIFFGSLLISPLVHKYGLFDLVLSPLIVIKNSLAAKNVFPYKFNLPAQYKEINYIRAYLPTIVITGIIMIITIPLLASANPFFNALLQNVLNFFDLEWLTKYIFADPFPIYVFRAIVFLFLMYFIPRMLTISTHETTINETKQFFSINYLIPKIAMGVVLVIFFITQAQLYFASAQTLQNMGYTNSRLTNEVFAQVTIVAFIVFLLVYLDKGKKAWNTKLAYFLIIESFFLIGIAFKSVYDYTSLWGLTQKRLWGYTSMTWLTGTLLFFIYHFRKHTPELHFLKQVMIFTMGVVLLINILNFDYLIYHYDKASTPAGVDYVYLSHLSPDAHAYKEVLAKLMEEIKKNPSYDYTQSNAAFMLLGNIDSFRYKYDKRKDVNTFNITEYQEYLATKDIDTNAYRRKLFEKQQKFNPTTK